MPHPRPCLPPSARCHVPVGQVALLRAAGIPAGYVLAHITKDAFLSPAMLDDVYNLISPITVHVFCAVYIPYASPTLSVPQATAMPSSSHGEHGTYRYYDATERTGASVLTECAATTSHKRMPAPAGPKPVPVMSIHACVRACAVPRARRYVPYTDETRLRQRWVRGPFSPVQGNLDHMLTPGTKIPPELLQRQNEAYHAHPI